MKSPKSAAAHVASTAWFLELLPRAVFGEWLAESDVAVVFRVFSPRVFSPSDGAAAG